MKNVFAVAAVAALLSVAGTASAHDYKLGDLQIGHPWSRATAGSSPNGAAYLTLNSTGKESDRLLSASSPAAEKAELHTHLMDDGVMKMRPVTAIEVTPGSPTALQPGGLHIMLLGLKAPLVKDKSFPLTLVFEKAGKIDVEVKVEAAGAPAAPMGQTPGAHKH